MAIKVLTGLGLAIIPFIFVPSWDLRDTRMGISVAIALALSLLALFKGQLKPFKNKAFLILIGYLLVSIFIAPKPSITLFGEEVNNFWVYQSMFYIITFSLMLVTVSGIHISYPEIRVLLYIMCWAGFLMSLYAIGQNFGVEQWFEKNPEVIHHEPTQWHIGGTLGQPTVLASFIAILVPIALYLENRVKALIMIIAVVLTQSWVAIGALGVSLLFLFGSYKKWCFIVSCIVLSLCIGFLSWGYFNLDCMKGIDSGRIARWKVIIQDTNKKLPALSKAYPYTGMGVGSFQYVHKVRNNDTFKEAHNDYLELASDAGWIGLLLFLYAIWWLFKDNPVLQVTGYRKHLLSSFVCILVCAGGTFFFQLAPHLFYAIVIVGLLHNRGGEGWAGDCLL